MQWICILLMDLPCFGVFICFLVRICTLGEYVWSGGVCPLVPRDLAREVKFSLCLLKHYATKACGITEGKAPRIFHFGNKLWVAFSFTPGPIGSPLPSEWSPFTHWRGTGCSQSGLDDMTIKTPWSNPQFAACCLRYILILFCPRQRLAVRVIPSG